MHPILAYLTKSRAGFRRFEASDKAELTRMMLGNHALIVASESLLEDAVAKLRGMQDDYDRALRAYYIEHLEEERGHERWLRNDLRELGVDVLAQPLNWLAATLAGLQYYLIKHVHPACLLGYMAALECVPTQMETIELLEQAHGVAPIRTARFHAEHDPYHGARILEMIDAAPEPLRELVQRNLTLTETYLKGLNHGG